MTTPNREFPDYCCELLASVGPCVARRMFGGWGLSTGGLTLALVADLGGGERLWLKADADTRGRFEAAGCARFTYLVKGQPKSLNYYSAPEEAMDSPAQMAPWARMALESALKSRVPSVKRTKSAPKKVAKSGPSGTRRPPGAG